MDYVFVGKSMGGVISDNMPPLIFNVSLILNNKFKDFTLSFQSRNPEPIFKFF
jgi:hypothetical protein